jgi:Zn-finger nucleic acid-binding protein
MSVGAWAMTGMAAVLVERDWRDEGEFTKLIHGRQTYIQDTTQNTEGRQTDRYPTEARKTYETDKKR